MVGTGPIVMLNPGHDGGNADHPAVINAPVDIGYGQTRPCDTTGTQTDAGYPEHTFNWDVTLRVRSLLQVHGVRVLLTRPNDTGVGPCVDKRTAAGNRPDIAAVVSIHADGAAASGYGFHVCEDSRQPAGAAVATQSHRLTVAMHDALVAGSGLAPSTYIGQDGYFPRNDLAALNLATRPATFLELGNMRNPGDAARPSSPAGRQQIAAAIARGILAFLRRS
jgi:N-acetylmuramoyl-L-alanine amidase